MARTGGKWGACWPCLHSCEHDEAASRSRHSSNRPAGTKSLGTLGRSECAIARLGRLQSNERYSGLEQVAPPPSDLAERSARQALSLKGLTTPTTLHTVVRAG